MTSFDNQIDNAIHMLITAEGGVGHIVINRNTNKVYLTTFPRYTKYGACPMGVPELNDIMIYTCEVRWPGSLSAGTETFTLGINDEAFVFSSKIVKGTSELTKRAVAMISENSRVSFADTWKPAANNRSITLQRLFTIEIRVDFRDESKLGLFEKIIQQAAQHVYGQSALLGDGVKPEIVIHGHDFFKGHTDIALFDDSVLKGETAIQEASERPFAPVAASGLVGSSETEAFSAELMEAIKK